MVRAKFQCQSVTTQSGHRAFYENGKYLRSEKCLMYSYKFVPVYSEKPDSENKKFWDATPSGLLEMTCVYYGLFEVGKEYYLDFSEAVEAVA